MERVAHSEEQAQQSWRAALLAPLRRLAAREEQTVTTDGAAAEPGREASGAPPNGQPLQTTGETTRSGRDRKRAIGTAAVGQVLANVYHDPTRHTVTLLLDEQHATAVIYAARVLAADYEAHALEVRAVAATLPSWSYGAENRQFIAIRHERVASRLRLVESNYRTEVSDGGRPAD